ncbi:hypothetical protein COU14_00830 [Candidatus Kaiserbacteria bacterium CG10_big_fil_rev_8_21_14_0_10_44_10]|uniref:Uncharacterized protein n=1 Tax=Candidatus Kaiserbacteria bacterium CG10_big_fil_rev_8_21_14_0_10_44_10 TaxID=1974606 RepID=A0A2H0UJY6_9BACT|nr:MAG: hypothetical protein COU14_00830 [Candidatus Kaiserbacteria bacterium CG10_big_fil_rev_8_21_14_0_10_44_10]
MTPANLAAIQSVVSKVRENSRRIFWCGTIEIDTEYSWNVVFKNDSGELERVVASNISEDPFNRGEFKQCRRNRVVDEAFFIESVTDVICKLK